MYSRDIGLVKKRMGQLAEWILKKKGMGHINPNRAWKIAQGIAKYRVPEWELEEMIFAALISATEEFDSNLPPKSGECGRVDKGERFLYFYRQKLGWLFLDRRRKLTVTLRALSQKSRKTIKECAMSEDLLNTVEDARMPSESGATGSGTRRMAAGAKAAINTADWKLLEQRYCARASPKQIAEELGLTVRAVRYALSRARKRFLAACLLVDGALLNGAWVPTPKNLEKSARAAA